MFTSSIFLLKNLPDGGRTWIYNLSTHDHLMHSGTNPKPKAEGSRHHQNIFLRYQPHPDTKSQR